MSCWTRRRTSPGASPASLTMWKASSTLVASWSWPSDGVLAVPGRGSSVAIRTPARKSSPRSASQFLYTVPDLPGTRSTQPCRGVFLPSRQVHDAGELTGARRRRSWWCHTCSSTPSTRTPAKRAGSSDAACRHGLIWDHTVFHVVASCRANPAMVDNSRINKPSTTCAQAHDDRNIWT